MEFIVYSVLLFIFMVNVMYFLSFVKQQAELDFSFSLYSFLMFYLKKYHLFSLYFTMINYSSNYSNNDFFLLFLLFSKYYSTYFFALFYLLILFISIHKGYTIISKKYFQKHLVIVYFIKPLDLLKEHLDCYIY